MSAAANTGWPRPAARGAVTAPAPHKQRAPSCAGTGYPTGRTVFDVARGRTGPSPEEGRGRQTVGHVAGVCDTA